MAQPVYRTAVHFVDLAIVETYDSEGDYTGDQNADEFFQSFAFPLWERTPHQDYQSPHGPIETYRTDITR